jgi:hypothetical protein
MFTLDFFNWDMFDTWEFDPRRCEGYLGDVVNLSCEYGGAPTMTTATRTMRMTTTM